MLTSQAVILCGGRGTRLGPITSSLPKPMAPVCGRPFLAHLLGQLKDNGFQEVVLLIGYLGHIIEDYFGDGKNFGLKIQYSRGPLEWDTGRRLWEARDLLHDHFLLLYSDNYATFFRERIERTYEKQGVLGCLSVHPRPEKNNVRLSPDGFVTEYDSTRRAPGLNAIEIGYALFSKKIFSFYDAPDCNFNEIILKLVQAGQVCAHVALDRYYSVSDPERLKITQDYFTPKKILLIDRDGTLNRKAPRGEYVSRWEDFAFIPGTIEALAAMAKLGYNFIVISNQAGVGRGVLTESQVWGIDRQMVGALAIHGVTILRSYYCFHHWEDNCECRKPKPGLLLRASQDFLFQLPQTWFIGDDPRDCTAAWEAGCRAAYVGNEEELATLPLDQRPALVLSELSGVIQALQP